MPRYGSAEQDEIDAQEAQESFERDQAEDAEYARLGAEWRKLWPCACPDCHGWGGRFTYPGGSYSTPPEFEPCEALPLDTCHRCGWRGMTDDGEGPCRSCGWTIGEDGEPG